MSQQAHPLLISDWEKSSNSDNNTSRRQLLVFFTYFIFSVQSDSSCLVCTSTANDVLPSHPARPTC